MHDLTTACAELTTALPAAACLITQPDTDGTNIHTNPTSRPPWNAQAATAVHNATEGARRLEAELFTEVTGRTRRRRGGSDKNTIAAINTIAALSPSASPATTRQATRLITTWVTTIHMLPAIDQAERWRKVTGVACRYCGTPMLRLGERSGRVTCLRYGACQDADGHHPVGYLTRSVSGEPMIAWNDGTNEYADVAPDYDDEAM